MSSTPPTPETTEATPHIMELNTQSPHLNPWEIHALSYTQQEAKDVHDGLIYPGIYSSSGVDILSVLVNIRCRPNPIIDIGLVDCSVAIVLCDLQAHDTPIIYVSDAWCSLTGYSRSQVLGRNCRFLQQPGTGGAATTSPQDKTAIQKMRQAVHGRQEVQVRMTNYKRNGQRFTNLLSMIPIQMGLNQHWYSVGFLSDVE